ncbi:spermidine synthase [Legionella septentrionalis]|uniref:spermidine synthase n=1 Tax=Legionella septentrionalis TaxID=2498109 RepID=UPI000F8F7ED2|nr:hypothetical protein [Legionella septentrionalis]RUQ99564.1 hypothetical protein ELY11_04380 [Legionella septentrionalis]RUR13636.1 hypothetical protein ELY10_10210 [Legionella septentrionalis]
MWKTLAGQCIFATPNGAKVHQNLFYRWLTLGSDSLQSMINRRNPAKPGLSYIKHLTFAVRTQPADCCLLGLGGAGVAHALAPLFPSLSMLAVENNPEVIHIAYKYFMAGEIKNLHVLQEDANLFVQQHTRRYQHVLLDLYEAHSFPSHCNTPKFFNACYNLLYKNGILAVNLANINEHWSIFRHIHTQFNGNLIALPVKNTANLIILACRTATLSPYLETLRKSGELKKLFWEPRWGHVAEI